MKLKARNNGEKFGSPQHIDGIKATGYDHQGNLVILF